MMFNLYPYLFSSLFYFSSYMFSLFRNNNSGHTPNFLSFPPVVSNTITIMTMTALVMTVSDSSNRRDSFSPPSLKTFTIAHLSGLMGKQTKLSLMSSCITFYLWTLSISLSQNQFYVMDSSKPLICIFPIAISSKWIFPHQDLRFQSDSQFHLASHSHYYANVSFTWRLELSS